LQPQTKLRDLPFTCVFDVVRANPDGASMSLIGQLLALQKQGVHYHWRIAQQKLKAMGHSLDKRRPGMNTQTQTEAPSGTPPKVYPPHPAAMIFPRMEGAEFKALVDDIKAHGLRERIVLLNNQVLDGRNRYAACVSAGVVPQFVQWVPKPGETAVEYVVSMNLTRRHLNETQRAMVAAQLEPLYAAEARARQKATQITDGTTAVASLPPPDAGKAREKAAARVHVSPRSVQEAKTVIATGIPALVAACEQGKASVSAAAEVSTLPRAQQRAVTAGGRPAVAKAAKKIRAKKQRETFAKQSADKPEQVVRRLLDEVKAAVKAAVAKWPKSASQRPLIQALTDMAEGLETA
jgi:hypothetical protein